MFSFGKQRPRLRGSDGGLRRSTLTSPALWCPGPEQPRSLAFGMESLSKLRSSHRATIRTGCRTIPTAAPPGMMIMIDHGDEDLTS